MQPANGASLRALYAWCSALRIALGCCVGEARAGLSAPSPGRGPPSRCNIRNAISGGQWLWCCFCCCSVAATGMISGREGRREALANGYGTRHPFLWFAHEPFLSPPGGPGRNVISGFLVPLHHSQFSDWSGGLLAPPARPSSVCCARQQKKNLGAVLIAIPRRSLPPFL